MFFKKRFNVIFRDYDSFGLITDNRNFGYKQKNHNDRYIGDKVLSKSGAVFMSVLEKQPQSLEILTKRIFEQFSNADYEVIKYDAKEFYRMLESDGFVASGETFQECDEKDTRFSYHTLETGIWRSEHSSNIVSHQKNTQEFLDEYFNGKPQLTNVHLEITSRCNERCIHCYIPHEYKTSQMKPDLFYEILMQCKEMRVLHLTLSGGEPMLHKKFCDFLKGCREFDLSVNILTNLTLLNDEILDEMKQNPLLGVQVSLYSMNETIHDEITQLNGSFGKTRDGILKLVENDIPVQISCPILKQNKNCYEEVAEWAGRYKIAVGDDFGIIGSYNHATNNLSCRLSIDEIKDLIDTKINKGHKYLEDIELAAEKKKNNREDDFVCSVCNASICINEEGMVYPCAGWQDYVVGNLRETCLQEIWDNSEKVQYLRSLRNRDLPKCKKCTDKDFCSICFVRNANENPEGDPLDANDFFCSIAKLNRELVIKHKGRS